MRVFLNQKLSESLKLLVGAPRLDFISYSSLLMYLGLDLENVVTIKHTNHPATRFG